MDLKTVIERLRKEPSAWSEFDEETKHLLMQQASQKQERLTKGFDPLTGSRIVE